MAWLAYGALRSATAASGWQGVLLVADEMICGFGQAGDWWGHQTMGFTPDPVSMAKGLSSGYVAQVDETVANARCSIEGTRAVLGRG